MIVSVLGLGYIGLPTAALLANAGHTVFGYDVDRSRCAALMRGEVETTENEVRELVLEALSSGRLQARPTLLPADAFVLCVPTPNVDNRPDLSYVETAARSVARIAEPGSAIVLESTVPPNTTERILERALHEESKDIDRFRIAHCPERIIPGATVREMRENARVIGTRSSEDGAFFRKLYGSFCHGDLHVTSISTAEFVKVIENTYRDVNIAYANELAMLGEELGIDAREAIALANHHPRVDILRPGPGVGGHCIPVDPQFLSNANPFVTELIQAARRVNERMPHFVARRVAEIAGTRAYGRKIALLGAAYKADVDDARESPTLRVDEHLRERGFTTAIYDPYVRAFSRPLEPSLEATLDGADAIVLMTDHTAFREIDPRDATAYVRSRVLVDTRAALDVRAWREAEFECYVLGERPLRREAEALA